MWEERFYPFHGPETYDDAEKNRKTIFYPDEYNYLYSYIFELNITKKDLKIKYIDFNEYDKISPLWVDLQNYLY